MKKLLILTATLLTYFFAFAQKEYKTFHENGHIKEVGIWKFYFKNGRAIGVGNYENGRKTGKDENPHRRGTKMDQKLVVKSNA